MMKPEVVYTKGLGVLAKFGHEGSFNRLVGQSHHWEEDVRRIAVRALGNCVDSRAAKPLIVRLTDWDERVRREARRSLGKIGADETIEPLIRGDETVVEPLIKKLSDNEYVREAMLALGDLGDKRAVRPLIEKLSDPDKGIRSYARIALVSLDDENANKLLERFNYFDYQMHLLLNWQGWKHPFIPPFKNSKSFVLESERSASLAWNLAKGNEERFQINLQIFKNATREFAVEKRNLLGWNEKIAITYSEFIYAVARYAIEQKILPENSSQFFRLFLDNLVITATIEQRSYTAYKQGRYLGTTMEILDVDHDPVKVETYEQIPYELLYECSIEKEDIVATLESLQANYPDVLKSYFPKQEG